MGGGGAAGDEPSHRIPSHLDDVLFLSVRVHKLFKAVNGPLSATQRAQNQREMGEVLGMLFGDGGDVLSTGKEHRVPRDEKKRRKSQKDAWRDLQAIKNVPESERGRLT